MSDESVLERIALYGGRSLLLVVALGALGIVLLVVGVVGGEPDSLMAGVLIIMLGIGLAWGFKQTVTAKITKQYFSPEALVGKTGRTEVSFRANTKGVIHLEHEYWTAISAEDLHAGDPVVVASAEPDKVTLRVRKLQP